MATFKKDVRKVASIMEEVTIYLALNDLEQIQNLSEFLQTNGFIVEVVDSFNDLSEKLTQFSARCFIIDTHFKEKFQGIEVARATVSRLTHKPFIIFTSSQNDLSLCLSCVRAGGAVFIPQPLDKSMLLEQLDSLIIDAMLVPYRMLMVMSDTKLKHKLFTLMSENSIQCHATDDLNNLLEDIGQFKPDIVLMGMHFEHCSGAQLARVIRQQPANQGLPIIFLASDYSLPKEYDPIQLGGDEFLTIDIEHHERWMAWLKCRAQRARGLKRLMSRDSLTNLLNHTAILGQLEIENKRAERQNRVFCFGMLDLDHFKEVNDSYGHYVGDIVLSRVAQFLRSQLRCSDIVGRYGGEEFAIILPETNLEQGKKVLNSLRKSLGKINHSANNKIFNVTVSVGLVESRRGLEAENLLSHADQVLYQAKARGRNQVVSVRVSSESDNLKLDYI